MLLRDVVDQLLDQHRLADAGAAEEADLAALMYGAIRSTTLMPVSKISIFGDSSLNEGGSRWIGQRSRRSAGVGLSSIGSPITFQSRPSVASPTGTVIGSPVSIDVDAAGEAVGRVHRDRAHAVVAEMLLHLRDQVDAGPPSVPGR